MTQQVGAFTQVATATVGVQAPVVVTPHQPGLADAYAIGFAIGRCRRKKRHCHDQAIAMALAAIKAGRQPRQHERRAA